MYVIKNLSIEIPWTNSHFFNLEEFHDENSKEALYQGYSLLEYGIDQNTLNQFDRNVYLNVTMPTEYQSPQDVFADRYFDEIWGICPYSCEWLNEINGKEKFFPICYPFNLRDIPQKTEKIYDVIYHGGLHSQEHVECLNIISKFNHRYSTLTWGINHLTQDHLGLATNTNLTNEEKFKLISECKISVCYNIVHTNQNVIDTIKTKPEWQKNKAFSHLESGMIPQFKSRFNEAAMSRTLNLVRKDHWNVVEHFYTPDEDFIYFSSNAELEEKIKDILNNWEQYEHIIENAYKKCLNYSTKNLYNAIKNREYKKWKK